MCCSSGIKEVPKQLFLWLLITSHVTRGFDINSCLVFLALIKEKTHFGKVPVHTWSCVGVIISQGHHVCWPFCVDVSFCSLLPRWHPHGLRPCVSGRARRRVRRCTSRHWRFGEGQTAPGFHASMLSVRKLEVQSAPRFRSTKHVLHISYSVFLNFIFN